MTKITKKQTKEIKEKLPSLQQLIEKEDTDYQMIFVSVFDHWLTQDEFQTEIHTENENELRIRRQNLQNFINGLFEITPTYSWKIKRKNRLFIYRFDTLNKIQKKCDIPNQHGETGQRYDIILPEVQAVYSEEWDWTNIIWFRDKKKIEPLIELVKKSGLHILIK